ncbi:phosphoribosylaminoimidazolesuccinocarboxamide synthase [Chitinophaga nivalis]|uniref:SAICAR synthetase/ADE2 N-terminal domain-containing protein n=1 Tax=Chitinophaga nivalis TaxID=2991709 RepID=A0ABT3ISA2_9BACT|nr:phosphoribosylaminoimidazolesuccinocarboxamide synthase [Chitinophaga nivalis]MCW3463443.1 hypothetical protein [Chitinophaga nivalis]MCW3486867.1 hypothetical protein [Chitinophaga nivalis]
MDTGIINHCSGLHREDVTRAIQELRSLGFSIEEAAAGTSGYVTCLELYDTFTAPAGHNCILVDHPGHEPVIELILQHLPFNFDALPLLVEGESKIIKYWTDKVVIEKFKPTVYSYTHNRYGSAAGTDDIRIRFTSALYRKMALLHTGIPYRPASAFLAEITHEQGLFVVQRLVDVCNIETRIKRFHIGSPVHRYLYTGKYPSTRRDEAPIVKWTRFEDPVVCFDWRHPLMDEEQRRLADEPISDDYAALWIRDVTFAKEMARNTFMWLEAMFFQAGITLIDMCIFIDRSGKMIYSEISPDCMRMRWNSNNIDQSESMDKDLWRRGAAPEKLYENYEKAYSLIFH